MSNTSAPRDNNRVPTLLATSSVDGTSPVVVYADPITHRLKVDISGAASGTVTSVSVVTANGISGSVANPTTTPAITLILGAITPSAIQVSGLTASQILGTDTSKNLVSLDTATYPTLVELSYVKGVTIAIQTQLNAKGTVSSVATDATLTGGTITTTGTLGINLGNANTWTVAQAFTSASPSVFKNFNTILWADQFSGADIGAQINAAYAALPTNGGHIMIPNGTYSFSTPISMSTQLKKATLEGVSARGTELRYTGTGDCITINNTGGGADYGFTALRNFTLTGNDVTVSSTQRGVVLGGANGAAGFSIDNVNITGFGTGLYMGKNCYIFTYKNSTLRNCSVHLLHMEAANNSGEDMRFENIIFTDPANGTPTDAVYLASGATASTIFMGCSFDDSQVHILGSNYNVNFVGGHFENPDSTAYGSYTYLVIAPSTNAKIGLTGMTFYNGAPVNTPPTCISNGANLTLTNVTVASNGAVTAIPYMVDNTDATRSKVTWSGVLNTSGNAFTSFINTATGTVALTQSGVVDTTTNPTLFRSNFAGGVSVVIEATDNAGIPLLQLKDSGSGGVSWNLETGRQSGTFDIFQGGGGGQRFSILSANGNVGIGITTPSAKIETLATTEQLRLSYDSTHYTSFTTGSTGILTLASSAGANGIVLQTDATSANFAITGSGIGTSASSSLTFAGAANVDWRGYSSGAAVTLAVAHSYASFITGSTTLTTAASGTHSMVANYAIKKLGTITSGGATLSNTASLYVEGQSTAGLNNYALFIDGGTVTTNGSFSKTAWGTSGVNLEIKAATYTDSSTASGTVSNNMVNTFAAPTLAAANASITYTNAATVLIAGAPIAGTNATLSRAMALYVSSGATALLGGVATTIGRTDANAFFSPLDDATTTSAQTYLQFAGSSNVHLRAMFGGQTSSTLSAGYGYSSVVVGSSPITTAATGTHGLLASAVFNPLGTVTSGGATVTETATVYIKGPGSGGTNNYAFHVASGNSIFNGNITLGTAGNALLITEGSNGRVGQVALVAGTKAITITGLTTSSRAFVTLVTPNTTTLTVTYQAVCTADTLTLRANVAAGTINVADISTLNYFVIN